MLQGSLNFVLKVKRIDLKHFEQIKSKYFDHVERKKEKLIRLEIVKEVKEKRSQ